MKITVHIRQKSTAASKNDDWFKGLDKAQQKQYIKDHPNSKYAQNAKRLAEEEPKKHGKKHASEPEANPKSKPKSESPDSSNSESIKSTLSKKISAIPEEHQSFFEHEQDVPGSKERKGIAKHIRTNKGDIIKNIKGQFVEWKDGCKAIGKLATGKSLSAHEKKALKGLMIDAAVTAAAVTVTGGFAHGAALAFKHVGFDVLKDIVLKSVIRGTVKATGASIGHTGVQFGLEALAADTKKKSKDTDARNEKILNLLVEEMANFIEKGVIPKVAWEKALDELGKKGKLK